MTVRIGIVGSRFIASAHAQATPKPPAPNSPRPFTDLNRKPADFWLQP